MLHDVVTKGSTDRSVTVRIIDSTDGTPETGVVFNTSGIDLWYRREGAVRTAITEATLAALTTAHADGGFLHVSDGVYRLDLPDAAVATGANYCDFGGTVTGMVVIGGRIRLVDYSLEDSVRMGLTALPNAAAAGVGGLLTAPTTANTGLADVTRLLGTAWLTPGVAGTPDVNAKLHGGTSQTGRDIGASVLLSSGTGTGQLDFTSGVVKANLAQILGTAITETAGQIAAAFKKFFDKATPTGTINSIPDAVAGAAGGLLIAGSNAATTVNITGNITGNLSGSVGSLTTNNDKTGYGLSSAAVQAIWDALTSALTTANSIGKLLVDNINATISSRATPAQVNTEADTALADVGLTTTITGRIDAAITTRAAASALATAQTSIDDIPTNAELATALGTADDAVLAQIVLVKAKTDLIPADIAAALFVVRTGTAQAGAAGTITLDASASATDDKYKYAAVTIISGTGIGQTRVGTGYVGSTKVLTVDTNWLINPDNTSGFKLESLMPATVGLSAAQVNAEVVDALATDTYAEPAQGAAGATISIVAKINYLYKAWRNKHTQTATEYDLYADNTTTIDQKASVSDDGTTFTRNEIASGP